MRPERSIAAVYPACAGIDLFAIISARCIDSLPRMRGDRPTYNNGSRGKDSFTPHARGSTHSVQMLCQGSLPRMRGDRPDHLFVLYCSYAFTPHARGSTSSKHLQDSLRFVYPACAGIDHFFLLVYQTVSCLPRMRGDRPDRVHPLDAGDKFTPHARGSTSRFHSSCLHGPVYPACAGIDPP